MATTAKKAAAKAEPKGAPAFPKNHPVTGLLSFPLWSAADIDRLAAWRAEKGYKAGQYPDKIGGSLFVTQQQVDKIQAYLLETFLPFTVEQYAHSNGSKGFDSEAANELSKLIANEDWSETNLPVRDLSEKDLANLGEDSEYVAKVVFSGAGGNDISKKALARDEDGGLEVVSIDFLAEDGHNIGDVDRLWWGAQNTFRGAFNLNAYTRDIKKGVVIHGISAYTRALYLRSDLPLNFGGGNDDEAVLEEDFED